ncbi:MAG TPA: DUF2795 domain-containing protein [Longimicrobiales bacterium]
MARSREDARDDRADVAHYPPNKIQHSLKGISYPADKEDLLETAERNGAPQIVMEVLRRLPDREYGGPQDVMKEAKPLI